MSHFSSFPSFIFLFYTFRLVVATSDSLSVAVPVESYRTSQADKVAYVQSIPQATSAKNADTKTKDISSSVVTDFASTVNILSANATVPFVPGQNLIGRLKGLQAVVDVNKV